MRSTRITFLFGCKEKTKTSKKISFVGEAILPVDLYAHVLYKYQYYGWLIQNIIRHRKLRKKGFIILSKVSEKIWIYILQIFNWKHTLLRTIGMTDSVRQIPYGWVDVFSWFRQWENLLILIMLLNKWNKFKCSQFHLAFQLERLNFLDQFGFSVVFIW